MKKEVVVSIVNKSSNQLPEYESMSSSGMDVRAFIDSDDPIVIKPGERKLVKTGLFVSIPPGYEIQVRPRSGLALKKGITVANTPGTIDADYRGEIGIILINLGPEDFTVENGDRIAQIVLQEVPPIVWREVQGLDDTARGSGGFGSTGV